MVKVGLAPDTISAKQNQWRSEVKIKIGKGIGDLEIRTDEGELLVGRCEDGTFVNEFHVMDVTVNLGADRFPTATLECEIFGNEHEIDIKEDEVVAQLIRRGVTRIEGRREQSET